MRQFTESHIDSNQFAHLARTKQLELQIGEIIMVIKRAVRNSKIFEIITLRQYDETVITIETKLRHWLIEKSEKNLKSLLRLIKEQVDPLRQLFDNEYVDDLEEAIREELDFLEDANFLKLV